jgi:hypothetical protein
MKKWRIELVTGEVRDVSEKDARWAIGKKIAKFIEFVWEINLDSVQI